MQVKTKKQISKDVVKLESSGELREVIINEDLLNPQEASVALCFRGENSSGIVQLSAKEIDMINKTIAPEMKKFGNIKVLKFGK